MKKELHEADYTFIFSPNTGWRKDLNLLLKDWLCSSNAELIEKVNEFLNKIKNKEFGKESIECPYDILTEWSENSLICIKHLAQRRITGQPNISILEEVAKAHVSASEAFLRLQECYKPEIKYFA